MLGAARGGHHFWNTHKHTNKSNSLFQIPQLSPFYFMFKLFPKVILGGSAFPYFRGPVIALNFSLTSHIPNSRFDSVQWQLLNSFLFQNSFFFFEKNCRSKSVKLGLQLENLGASLQQHVTWPLSLTCEDIEGFLTDERHSMGPHARSKAKLGPDPVSGPAFSTKHSANSNSAYQFYFPALKQMHNIGKKRIAIRGLFYKQNP